MAGRRPSWGTWDAEALPGMRAVRSKERSTVLLGADWRERSEGSPASPLACPSNEKRRAYFTVTATSSRIVCGDACVDNLTTNDPLQARS